METHRSCIKPFVFPDNIERKEMSIILNFDYRGNDASLDVTISHDELVNKIKEEKRKRIYGCQKSGGFREFLVKQVGKRARRIDGYITD